MAKSDWKTYRKSASSRSIDRRVFAVMCGIKSRWKLDFGVGVDWKSNHRSCRSTVRVETGEMQEDRRKGSESANSQILANKKER
jgi:hypothetical protein